MHARSVSPQSDRERTVARRFADAFERDDIEAVVDLLTEDAWLRMPPYPHAYFGRDAIAGFLRASASWRSARRYRLVSTRANTQPAFGCYLQDERGPSARPAGLIVLTIDEDGVTVVTRFMDAAIFGSFGFAPTLPGS